MQRRSTSVSLPERRHVTTAASFDSQASPFRRTHDSRFLYTNATYNQVYITLLMSIRERKALTVLTGEPGTGKTTLLHLLTASLDDTFSVVVIEHPPQTFAELVSTLCDRLSLRINEDSTAARLEFIEDRLRSRAFRGETTALIIDNAHTLDPCIWGHLQRFFDLRGPSGNLLSLILAGHPQLAQQFALPDAHALAQQLAIHCHLPTLSDEEVEAFIQYRLQTAGWTQKYLFSLAAIARIAHHSHGVPQHINTICDNTLRTAYALERKTISSQLVDEAMSRLQLQQEPSSTEVPSTQTFPTPPIERLGFPPTRQSWRALQHLRTRLVLISKKMIMVGVVAFLLFAGLTVWNQVSSSWPDGLLPRLQTALAFFTLWTAPSLEAPHSPPSPPSPKSRQQSPTQQKRGKTSPPAPDTPLSSERKSALQMPSTATAQAQSSATK